MRRKIGLFNEEAGDTALVHSLLEWMHRAKADFTNTFAALARPAPDEIFRQWQETWQARLARQPQSPGESAALRNAHNPAFIPRNHLVEAALAAGQSGDTGPMERLLEILATPYDHARDVPEYRSPDPAGGAGYKTFCGT
jgi:uncharacterized protein YdiU (UPF0061 family)